MRRPLKAGLIFAGLGFASGNVAHAAAVCVPIEEGRFRCEIAKAEDCQKINDYPYARNLYCPAAFDAAQTMVAQVAKTLGAAGPSAGSFFYYQTPPDPLAPPDSQSQTTIPCLDTPAPYPGGSKVVVGSGTPLCHLLAVATSPGPVDEQPKDSGGNPVPDTLRAFPDYFGKLYSPGKGFPLNQFKTGSVFDALVTALGASAHDGFISDYPKFATNRLYLPDKWQKESAYHGISGGGGGGWGGEIAIVGGHGPVVQLAFGGGGGGGMTSFQASSSSTPVTRLGAGGGGGVQFANGYRMKGKSYNGLGLGAGMGSDEAAVQYSYNDFDGSGRAPQPVHDFNAPLIADYEAQLNNLADQLASNYNKNKTIVLRGGGGMGAGSEYLRSNGEEFEPHALSTQGGFQFSYEFRKARASANDAGLQALDNLNDEQESIYAFIGDSYQAASQLAFEQCGRDYSRFDCMCPKQHAIVICLVEAKVGDPTKVPAWLQERHCPDDAPAAPNQAGNGFTSYQQVLLASSAVPPACTSVLQQYFTNLNTPVN